MPQLALTAKQIHIIVQAIVLSKDELVDSQIAKSSEIETLRNVLQNVKGV